jgi:hypothetical protein
LSEVYCKNIPQSRNDDLVKSLKRHISVIPAKFPMPRLEAWHPRMDENGLFSNEAGIKLSPLTLPLSPANGGEGGGEGGE